MSASYGGFWQFVQRKWFVLPRGKILFWNMFPLSQKTFRAENRLFSNIFLLAVIWNTTYVCVCARACSGFWVVLQIYVSLSPDEFCSYWFLMLYFYIYFVTKFIPVLIVILSNRGSTVLPTETEILFGEGERKQKTVIWMFLTCPVKYTIFF